jgi:hypothetical protein
MQQRLNPGRSTLAPLRVRAKLICHCKHSVGEPGREVCADQRCGKCSPGFSDTLGVQVRPVGVYVGNVVLLWAVMRGIQTPVQDDYI